MLKPLEISSLNKKFNNNQVLNNINIDINPGEIFGLVGLNGVGKTTLIRIILDLIYRDSGDIKIFGEENTNPESRRKLAYLPEKFYPSQFLKGEEFLSLSLSYYKMKYEEEKVRKHTEILELDYEILSSKISKYSKGMAQKLGLLSVFLSEAPLMILDEPMSGLDPKARIQLKKLLINYSKEKHNTIFFTSHILLDIDEICDRIAVLNKGEIIFIGTPEEFRKTHNSNNLEHAFLKSIELV